MPPAKKSRSLEQISHVFHMPLVSAAHALHISPTSLKRLCRQLKIRSWPYRNIRRSMECRIGDSNPSSAIPSPTDSESVDLGIGPSVATSATLVPTGHLPVRALLSHSVQQLPLPTVGPTASSTTGPTRTNPSAFTGRTQPRHSNYPSSLCRTGYPDSAADSFVAASFPSANSSGPQRSSAPTMMNGASTVGTYPFLGAYLTTNDALPLPLPLPLPPPLHSVSTMPMTGSVTSYPSQSGNDPSWTWSGFRVHNPMSSNSAVGLSPFSVAGFDGNGDPSIYSGLQVGLDGKKADFGIPISIPGPVSGRPGESVSTVPYWTSLGQQRSPPVPTNTGGTEPFSALGTYFPPQFSNIDATKKSDTHLPKPMGSGVACVGVRQGSASAMSSLESISTTADVGRLGGTSNENSRPLSKVTDFAHSSNQFQFQFQNSTQFPSPLCGPVNNLQSDIHVPSPTQRHTTSGRSTEYTNQDSRFHSDPSSYMGYTSSSFVPFLPSALSMNHHRHNHSLQNHQSSFESESAAPRLSVESHLHPTSPPEWGIYSSQNHVGVPYSVFTSIKSPSQLGDVSLDRPVAGPRKTATVRVIQ